MEYCINWYAPVSAALLDGRWQIDIGSDYPFEPEVRIRIKCMDGRPDNMLFRIPAWSRKTEFVLDGKACSPEPGTYYRVKKDWSRETEIFIRFDFSLWQWTGEKEKEGRCSLYRGPVLLAYDDRFNQIRAEEAAGIVIDPSTAQHLGDGRVLFASDRGDVLLTPFAEAGMTGSKYRTWLTTSAPVRDVSKTLRGI